MNAAQFEPHEEPILDVDDIQGNVLPGFMKPHMRFISVGFGDVTQARAFLAGLNVASLSDVFGTRKDVRAARGLRPAGDRVGAVPEGLSDLWLNVAVSYAGLKKLAGHSPSRQAEVDAFTDNAFRLGLPARSAGLGDPVDPSAEGNPVNWVVGGPDKQADLLIVLAADDPKRLAARAHDLQNDARNHDLEILHEDTGAKLDKRGSEHFGFQDGISQPGVRGRISEDEYLSHRVIKNEPDKWLYGLPGQLLLWPGEFVFGYPASSPDPMVPGPVRLEGPAWSRNGSYLVYRRLRQNVAGFWAFIAKQAEALRNQPGFGDWTDDRLAAAIVGRWKSGAPLLRAPHEDNEALGTDRLANNSFGYAKAAESLTLINGETTEGEWPEAVADPIGTVCPQVAHIRKVNTRETANDMGGSRAGLERRILRRGISYGEPLLNPTEPDPANGDRGLLFVSYQSSIERQFEFLNNRWMGSPTNPRSPGGHDMFVGQNGQPGENRQRRCTILGGVVGTSMATASLVADQDFVIPTGGGYFFSPSISALRNILSRNEQRGGTTSHRVARTVENGPGHPA
jgi:Dyp-type peroxidase family